MKLLILTTMKSMNEKLGVDNDMKTIALDVNHMASPLTWAVHIYILKQ